MGVKGGCGQLGTCLPNSAGPSVGSLKSATVGVFAPQRLTHATNQALKKKSLSPNYTEVIVEKKMKHTRSKRLYL